MEESSYVSVLMYVCVIIFLVAYTCALNANMLKGPSHLNISSI